MGTSFKDKTVIITGASMGVGAACARAFCAEGANLVLVARGADALNTLASELEHSTGVLAVAMDVADFGEKDASLAETVSVSSVRSELHVYYADW